MLGYFAVIRYDFGALLLALRLVREFLLAVRFVHVFGLWAPDEAVGYVHAS